MAQKQSAFASPRYVLSKAFVLRFSHFLLVVYVAVCGYLWHKWVVIRVLGMKLATEIDSVAQLENEGNEQPMSVKVMFGQEGAYAVCDTPAEALELLKTSANGLAPKARQESESLSKPSDESRGEDTRIAIVFSTINSNSRKWLNMLLEFPEGSEADVIAERSGVAPASVGGILGGVSKAAKKNRLRIEDLVFSESRFEGRRRYRFLMPGPKLLKYAGRLREEIEKAKGHGA